MDWDEVTLWGAIVSSWKVKIEFLLICLQVPFISQLKVQCQHHGLWTLPTISEKNMQTQWRTSISVTTFSSKTCILKWDSFVRNCPFLSNASYFPQTELLECVAHSLPTLMNRNPIGLIIIDSVGAVFRIASNYIRRAEQMRELSKSLLKLSMEHGCAVVCVNQVNCTWCSSISFKTIHFHFQVSAVINRLPSNSTEDQVVPCLGLVWANLVNTRLQISRTNKTLNATTEPIRKIKILFAPDLQQDSTEFVITSNGITDIHSR